MRGEEGKGRRREEGGREEDERITSNKDGTSVKLISGREKEKRIRRE